MQRISTLIKAQTAHESRFPVRGLDGYAGEQDGTHVCFTDVLVFSSREDADKQFPDGVPDYVHLHWANWQHITCCPSQWEAVFGWWSDAPSKSTEHNPLA